MREGLEDEPPEGPVSGGALVDAFHLGARLLDEQVVLDAGGASGDARHAPRQLSKWLTIASESSVASS